MRLQGTSWALGAGAVCGLVAFVVGGAFHWIYLSTLVGMTWAFIRLDR